MNSLFFFVNILVAAAVCSAIPLQQESGRCILRTRSGSDKLPGIFGSKGPVPLTQGAEDWSFDISSEIGQGFTIYCAGVNNTLRNFEHKAIPAWCDYAGNVQTEYGPVTLDDLLCSTLVTESVVKVGTCYNGFTKIHIKLDNDPFIEVCHDEARSETLYSMHTLNGPDLDKSESINRPSFKEGGMYPNIDADKCYTQVEQVKSAAEILGSTAQATKYIKTSTNYFFSRGHLTANGDGIYAHEKRATFYFINVVPQWQIINAGNWEAQWAETRLNRTIYSTKPTNPWQLPGFLYNKGFNILFFQKLEASLRDIAQSRQALIKVYTGASGVSTLKDVNNNDAPIYLGKDSTGKLMNVLPVPKFMYKVIINEAAGTGVVVVTINNPYSENHKSSDVLCESVCDQINWITFNTSDFIRGYTYCCDIKTFYNKLPVFPYPGDLPLLK